MPDRDFWAEAELALDRFTDNAGQFVYPDPVPLVMALTNLLHWRSQHPDA